MTIEEAVKIIECYNEWQNTGILPVGSKLSETTNNIERARLVNRAHDNIYRLWKRMNTIAENHSLSMMKIFPHRNGVMEIMTTYSMMV